MVKKNENFNLLPQNYLFPEIQKKKQAFLSEHPDKTLISLGIGDTTQPIPEVISQEMSLAAQRLSSPAGYTGYGPEQGHAKLRELLSETYYQGSVHPNEIFISDGAKCDTGRLLNVFGDGLSIAVQDPTYPVYVDTTTLSGKAKEIFYLPCSSDNHFFPDLTSIKKVDLIYFCSPNNPTGSVATKGQLEQLVSFAAEHNAIIIFDAAYAFFIQDDTLPRSIYEIEGADRVAIEINSFSKLAGFTGVRLGWTVVPENLRFEDGSSVRQAWNRIASTFFNGASSLAQAGGVAVLSPEGLRQIGKIRDFYLENAMLIRETFESLGFQAFGGENAPYVWVDFSPKNSWEMFDELLHYTQVLSVPGSGFGAAGEGFLRFSAFASRQDVLESMARLTAHSANLPAMAGSP